MSAQKRMCGIIAVSLMAVLLGTAARAQNLDEGKSAAALFANGCAACHRSPRGLAKGRFRLTLFAFLQQHYSTSSSTAWALTSYLESVDGPSRGQPRRPGAPKPKHSAQRPDGDPAARPPAAVR
jgi:mono/diheme cytochrome c family protein